MFNCFFVVWVIGFSPVASMGSEKPMFAGMKLFRRAMIEMTDSTAPAALVVCPVYDLVEEKGGMFSPNTLLSAMLS